MVIQQKHLIFIEDFVKVAPFYNSSRATSDIYSIRIHDIEFEISL